jgi:hypothetical protein
VESQGGEAVQLEGLQSGGVGVNFSS